MANISHFTQTVNGVSTTYDIHDANAFPKSGGKITGTSIKRSVNNNHLEITGGTDYDSGPSLVLTSYNSTEGWQPQGSFVLHTNNHNLIGYPNGTLTWGSKNVAMQEDVIPRSGGAVMTGVKLSRNTNDSTFELHGGTGQNDGGAIIIVGSSFNWEQGRGTVAFSPMLSETVYEQMFIYPSGTWTWTGTACQIISDQRYKQQISQIDDKLLDAWEDVNPVQFKYNDAVKEKSDNARLHTGYVVQQIDSACKSHGVDISNYGLYCHEEYPEETEEVEIEQEDGTKTKEKKVIREASEHYSLRYTETLVVECAYLRKCIKELRNEIEELKSSK